MRRYLTKTLKIHANHWEKTFIGKEVFIRGYETAAKVLGDYLYPTQKYIYVRDTFFFTR